MCPIWWRSQQILNIKYSELIIYLFIFFFGCSDDVNLLVNVAFSSNISNNLFLLSISGALAFRRIQAIISSTEQSCLQWRRLYILCLKSKYNIHNAKPVWSTFPVTNNWKYTFVIMSFCFLVAKLLLSVNIYSNWFERSTALIIMISRSI